MKLNYKITLFFIITCFPLAFSQDFIYPTKGIDKVEITSRVSVILKTHNYSNILISNKENKRVKKAAFGLKSTFGKDNTGFNVYVEQDNSILKIESFHPRTEDDLIIYLPENIKIFAEIINNNDITISDFRNEIEAKTNNGDIKIENVNGPVIIENSNGNTFLKFNEVNQNYPMSIINSHGDIDITLLENTKANLEISVPRGDLYTDLELTTIEKQEKGLDAYEKRDSRYIKSKLNDGGVNITIVSSRGNVYLRKK